MTRELLGIAALFVVALVGCSSNATTEPLEQDSVAEEPATASPGEVDLTPVDRSGYDAVLQEQTGKVVLVDFWATWCAPCMQQLGHTVELAARHKDLAVITMAMEDPEDTAALTKALVARDATATINLVSKAGGGSPSMTEFDIPGGSLPHYKLYDRSGKLRQVIALDPGAEKQFTTDDIDAAVEKLLTE